MENIKIFLPIISGKNSMNFYRWKKHDVLQINKFGMLEPIKSFKNICSKYNAHTIISI